MTESPTERLLRVVRDPGQDENARHAAIRALTDLRTRTAADALLELGGREDESDAILRAAGNALAVLQTQGVTVSEWDIRNLARPAAEAFLE
jgi:hypothetical protein